MKYTKPIFAIFFFVSFFAYLLEASFQFWMILIFGYLVLTLINIKNALAFKFPLGELMTLAFFIDNVFAVSLLQVINGDELVVGRGYFLAIPIMEYLPFAFIAIQSFLLGYYAIKVPGKLWVQFVENLPTNVSKRDIYIVLLFGLGGPLLRLTNISSLNYVSYTLTFFFTCGLIGLVIYTRSVKSFYFIGGLALNIFTTIKSAMFAALIYFVIYSAVMFGVIRTSSGKKVNYIVVLSAFLLGALFLSYLQNIKSDYRAIAWRSSTESGDDFFDVVDDNVSSSNILVKEFYLPILYRMNQGYQVSSVMKKVPSREPFANGETIWNTITGALTPRLFNPEKEEAGGRAKISRFTDIILVGGTSMNIGILGETYANFGIFGSFIFLFLYGITVAYFERFLLNYSLKVPMILLFFPIFFRVLFGSGTDYLMVVNSIAKASIIIFGFLYILKKNRKEPSPLIV